MNREIAIERAKRFFDDGSFFNLLAPRIARPTGSRGSRRREEMLAYLTEEIIPSLQRLDFSCRVVENAAEFNAPFMIGRRVEEASKPTVLIYGHGDTVPGMDADWENGLSPWKLTMKGNRWYGRGTADNKGQHTVNLAALACLLEQRGRLGFNVTVLMEMGEESGSPGLHAICGQERDALKSDVLFASDGPRIGPTRPTIFGGSRGVFDFDISLVLREGGHHSGNWGGLLANPGIILSHAVACMVDAHGRILVPALRPESIPDSIRRTLARLEVVGEGGPAIDTGWGEPGLSPAEKVYGWNTLEVLAFECGNPAAPVNAIPPRARVRCHIRFVADSDPSIFIPAIRKYLDSHGFSMVDITPLPNNYGRATRMEPDNPWVKFTVASFKKTLNPKDHQKITFLPNLGGTLPNDAFSHILGVPTIWIPHSYGGCSQHAPNEHLLAPIAREGLQLMTGLFWDLGSEKGITLAGSTAAP